MAANNRLRRPATRPPAGGVRAEPAPRPFEFDLGHLDRYLPATTDPTVRQLQTALQTASAPVPPRGSITPEAAAAMRTALSLWEDVVGNTSVSLVRADWHALCRDIPPEIATRARAEIQQFSATLAATGNPDHGWFQEASALVDRRGRGTPRRSAARLFAQGRDSLEELLALRRSLDALRAALTKPAARP